MTNKNSTNILSISFLLLFCLLISCAKNEVEAAKEAQVKVVNVIESAEPQDFYLDRIKIINNALIYSQISEYFTVTTGNMYGVIFRSISFISNSVEQVQSFETGNKYILFACSNLPSPNPAAS